MDAAFRARLLEFGLRTIQLASALPKTPAASVLARQLVRAGTSVGANFEEADGAFTRKDWLYRLNVAKSEAKETCYWIRLIKKARIGPEALLTSAESENIEIIKILTSSVKTAQLKRPKF
ncbi:MAG: four helix bundle protein [Acidobacteria bacterium]|nr:four helix bundle protein [Acidobacteriota bacterium]